jgi:dephospho-CoA kinase
MQRSGWTETAGAQRVIAQQARREQRRALADAVIHNAGLSADALGDEVAPACGTVDPIGRLTDKRP